MTKRRMITQPVYANAYYDQSVAIEFHEMDIAVILANIEYWVTVNELHEKDWDNPVHLHDGKWWTFGSVEYYSKYFPHLTYKQVKVRLQKLEDAGYIVSGNYNKISLDRTKWYTLSDEYRQIRQAEIDAVNSEKNGKNTDSDSPKRVNMLTQTGQSSTTVRLDRMGQAIPDNKPYPDNKQQTDSVMVSSMVSSSVSTQDAESTASDRELSAPSSFEASSTKRTDEVDEQDTTQQPSTESKVPRNQASVIYSTLRSRLGRAARNHHLPQDVRDRASKQLLMLKNSATNRRIKENLQNMIELSDADIVKQAVLDSLNAVYTDRDGSPQNTNVVRLLSMEDYQMALSIMQGNIKDPTALIEKIGDDIEEE